MSERFSFQVEEGGQRLDVFLANRLSGKVDSASRSAIQQWIRAGDVLVNGEKVKPRHSLRADDQVEVSVPEPVSDELLPEKMDLVILFEDEDIIVIEKPAGLVVHPGSGNRDGTLVNGLLAHCGGKLSRLADEDRPGIVHRLDKETSGCLVAAKSDEAYRSLVEQFSGRETEKWYVAVVSGTPSERNGRIENRIGRHPVNRQKMAVRPEPEGKIAITDYEVESAADDGSWARVLCRIHTGRTHQIRVHMKESLACPILGDEIYGHRNRRKVTAPRLMLHAWKLGFRHPVEGTALKFEAELPSEFSAYASSG